MGRILVTGADGFIGSHLTETPLGRGLAETIAWFREPGNLRSYKLR